jgi:ABC-type oligopeptide transport system substrate-binding subunit
MAGPYFFKDPGPPVIVARNPNYHGSRPRNFKRIQVTPDVAKDKAVKLVGEGKADYPLDGVPFEDVDKLRAGSGGSGASLSENTLLGTSYLFMNIQRPLFQDTKLRQAVNFAIDRTTLARLGATASELAQRPTDQYLPPGMPGFRPVSVYPNKPDLARARALAGSKHRRAIYYTCDQRNCTEIAQVVKTELAAIGISVIVKKFPIQQFYARLGKPGEPFDIALANWIADYADAAEFIDLVIGKGGGIEPGLTDKRVLARLAATYKLTGARRLLAYGRLENDLVRAALPWAAISNPVSADVLSARIGCRLYQPLYGMDLGALCPRGGAKKG